MDGLLVGLGDGARTASTAAAIRASFFDFDDRGNMEEADLKPNLAEFFGGNGGGVPSSRSGYLGLPELLATLFIYFALINRSIAPSASSTSIGTGGFRCSGL